jgi:hypothetical protein
VTIRKTEPVLPTLSITTPRGLGRSSTAAAASGRSDETGDTTGSVAAALT